MGAVGRLTSEEVGFCPGDASRGARVLPGDAAWVDCVFGPFPGASQCSGAARPPWAFLGAARGAVPVDPLCAGVQALPRVKPLGGALRLNSCLAKKTLVFRSRTNMFSVS